MTKYAADHAGALADIAEAGASVTFTQTIPGAYDSLTDTNGANTTSTVTGSAIKVSGRPKKYEALGLKESEAPTLLFAPTTYGQEPALGASVTWGSATYTVRDVDAFAIDGTTLMSYVVIAR